MKTIELKMSLVLGDTSVDHGHQSLFAALARLSDMEDADFGPACLTVFDTLERDFREEEAHMESAMWDGLPAHREQHARLLGDLHHAAAALDQGDCSPARRAVRLLPQWLELHIVTFDADMLAACPLATTVQASPAGPMKAGD
jgi:hemerythrin